MKIKFRNLLSLFLALLFILPAGCVTVFAAPQYTPIVYVYGYTGVYVYNDDGTYYTPIDDTAPPETTDSDIISASIGELLPLFAKAVVTDDYDEYCEKTLEALTPIYDEIRPNPDGTVPANTNCGWSWSYNSLKANPGRNDYYAYRWDTRLSPLDAADDLNDYIEAIKQKTGADKIVLVSRCAGTEVAASYLYLYQKDIGYSGIEKSIFIGSALNGFDFFELIASGNITVPDEALYRFTKYYKILEQIEDNEIYEFINSMLGMLETTMGLKVTISLVEKIYAKIKDKLIAPFLKSYYGISLGQVASIKDHYEEYKSYVFSEEGDLEKYSAIIEKADYYHYNVQAGVPEMLKEMNDSGTPVYIVSNYGEQMYPIGEISNMAGDKYANVTDTSFGATISTVTGTLSDSYIASREAAGYGKYISPDRQIDMSTAMFPDQTWLIKNLDHNYNGNDVYGIVITIARTDGITVDTLEEYPQFLNSVNDNSGLVPAQAVNDNDIDWNAYEEEAKEGTSDFFTIVIAFFRNIVLKVIEFIQGIIAHAKA